MSTIKADNIATLAGVSTSMANAVNGSAKAWVNFNAIGTVSIRGSYNVSSITDNGVGNFTMNFTNAMPDTNYNVVTSINYNNSLLITNINACYQESNTSNVRIVCGDASSNKFDFYSNSVAIFR